jgi:hypothetical protein
MTTASFSKSSREGNLYQFYFIFQLLSVAASLSTAPSPSLAMLTFSLRLCARCRKLAKCPPAFAPPQGAMMKAFLSGNLISY